MKGKILKGGGYILAWMINALGFVLYSAVLVISYAKLGMWLTLILMSFICFCLVLGLIKAYDKSGRDWFMFEKIKKNKWGGGLISWFLKQHHLISIPILTFKMNPFLLIILTRKLEITGLEREDKRNLIISVLTFNSYLLVLTKVGIDIIPHIFQ